MTEETIFAEALARVPEARAAYLSEACGSNAALRARVESLIASYDRAGSFLAEPAMDVTQDAGTKRAAEQPGQTIGRYKLLQLIGEGGFGSVFMAEQEHPVRRRVALKIIKLGMDTKQVIARFEAERQALAMMDHPNIARVLDAGATETGRPYFVMELVPGIPFTQFCDENKLSTRQRLELFVQVCQAVQHAHQKGIIHRDLKPSNVLVSMRDDRPMPKVIDFGIAKATQARLTEKTLFTEFRQFIGTPQYMSPEQAHSSGLDVDTRSDIYSLGVLLYELLTGTTPIDAARLRNMALDEMQRAIRDDDAPRPSTRLSTLGAGLATVAAHHQADPRKLRQLMRGELDWIVMKALEKDRSRRYETANALAMDVKRHLEGEIVLARPASAAYRLRKLVRRHRTAFAAAAVIAAGMLVALIVAGYGLRKARMALDAEAQQKQLAQAREVEANKQAANAAAVSAFLREMLGAADPLSPPRFGANLRIRDLLSNAVRRLDEGGIADPLIEADIRLSLGSVFFGLGMEAPARAQFDKVLTTRKRLLGSQSAGVAEALSALSGVLTNDRQAEAGEVAAREALEINRRIYGDEHIASDGAAYALGRSLVYQQNYDGVRELATARIAILRRLSESQQERLGSWLNLLAIANDQDEQLLSQSLAELRKRFPEGSAALVFPLNNLAGVYVARGDKKRGEPLYQEAWDLAQKHMGQEHFFAMHVFCRLINSRNADPAALAADYQRTIQSYQERLGRDHITLAWLRFGAALYLREHAEQRDTAIALMRESIATWQQIEGADSLSAGTRMLDLAYTLHMANKDEECEGLYRRSLAARRKAGNHSDVGEGLMRLAEFLTDRHDYAAAEVAWLEMRDWRAAHPKYSGYPSELEINQRLNSIYAAWGRPQRIARLNPQRDEELRRLTARLDTMAEHTPQYVETLERRATLNVSGGRFDAAAADFAKVFELDGARHLALYRAGAIAAYQQDREAWARDAREMLDRFGASDQSDLLERGAKLCLVMNPPAADPKRCLAQIETAMSRKLNFNWYAASRALAHYRLGQHRECVTWARKAKDLDNEAPPVHVLCDLLLAMSHHQLAQTAECAAAWKLTEERIKIHFRPPPEGDPAQFSVEDFMFIHVLHREAAELLRKTAEGKP